MTQRPHENLDLIRRVLGQDYLLLELKSLKLDEQAGQAASRVTVELADSAAQQELTGEGVGVVAALFAALLKRFAPEYQSLMSIELASFSVAANLSTKQDKAGVDAMCVAKLEVRNSENRVFSFAHSSRSVTFSVANAVLAAVEYFINAERAFIMLYRSREDARERGRHDLVTRYTSELAEVVKSTSYAEVIENMKSSL